MRRPHSASLRKWEEYVNWSTQDSRCGAIITCAVPRISLTVPEKRTAWERGLMMRATSMICSSERLPLCLMFLTCTYWEELIKRFREGRLRRRLTLNPDIGEESHRAIISQRVWLTIVSMKNKFNDTPGVPLTWAGIK